MKNILSISFLLITFNVFSQDTSPTKNSEKVECLGKINFEEGTVEDEFIIFSIEPLEENSDIKVITIQVPDRGGEESIYFTDEEGNKVPNVEVISNDSGTFFTGKFPGKGKIYIINK